MAIEKIKAVKGTCDILPGEVELWQRIEEVVRERTEIYGYSEIRTPIFEDTSLFARSIGEDTDIVGKEMYTFHDLGNRSLTLRPEGTASVIRAFIEHSLDQKGLPQKLWYCGPMFRQERPQKGRQRQFHQFGVEVVGSKSPLVDAEVMILFDDIAKKLGIDDRVYLVNSVGGAESRRRYKVALVDFLTGVEEQLCDDCKRRMVTNPLRVLDCKVPGCRTVIHDSDSMPRTVEYLMDDDCSDYEEVKRCLITSGIEFKEDFSLVRGLDYYTGTVFEMQCKGLGAQSAIMGGGRYDNLLKDLGGPDLSSVGFACGIERLILAMEFSGTSSIGKKPVSVFIATNQTEYRIAAMNYLSVLRNLGYVSEMDYLDRSMKAQMKTADRLQSRYVLIIESSDDRITVRDMSHSEQKTMTFEQFLKTICSEI
ncbi:MAG: histidine--tRNA ligase [Candidatus Latescibacterota bacterium]